MQNLGDRDGSQAFSGRWDAAGHVAMLQRSPTYLVARPSVYAADQETEASERGETTLSARRAQNRMMTSQLKVNCSLRVPLSYAF